MEWLPDGGIPLHTVCLTDATLGSREESEQPSMTNQDRGPILTVSSAPCTVQLPSSLERSTPGSDCAHINTGET